jgi:hypothetical protein
MVGDGFELAETTAWGDAVEDALFGCMSFSVESVSAPAITEVNTVAERAMLSGLFIFLLSFMNSRQEVLLIAFSHSVSPQRFCFFSLEFSK